MEYPFYFLINCQQFAVYVSIVNPVPFIHYHQRVKCVVNKSNQKRNRKRKKKMKIIWNVFIHFFSFYFGIVSTFPLYEILIFVSLFPFFIRSPLRLNDLSQFHVRAHVEIEKKSKQKTIYSFHSDFYGCFSEASREQKTIKQAAHTANEKLCAYKLGIHNAKSVEYCRMGPKRLHRTMYWGKSKTNIR